MFTCDRAATKAEFKRTGRSIAAWAKIKGFDAEVFRQFINGHYNPSAKVLQKYCEALQADGLLVEEKPEAA
jgi:hypothetical protein